MHLVYAYSFHCVQINYEFYIGIFKNISLRARSGFFKILQTFCLQIIYKYIYIYIYIYICKLFINSDLGKRSPGGSHVLRREYVPSRQIRSKWSRNSPWLVNSASLICGMNRWPSGRVSASAYCGCWFDLQCWCDLMRSKQLFSAPYVVYIYIYIYMSYVYIYIYIYI